MCRCAHFNSLESVRRDLHDQIGSPLAGLVMQVELARQLVRKGDAEGAFMVLTETREDLADLMARTRRIVSNTGAMQTAADIDQALRTMLKRMNRTVSPRLGISLDAGPEIRTVSDEIAQIAFLIVREAVTNVLKHSNARNCMVTLRVEDGALRVLVVDDGHVPRKQRPSTGSGLSNMAARAKEVGGWCTAKPGRTRGFVVTAFLPLSPDRQSVPP